MLKNVKVGIVGASASGGWAKDSHVPAVRALEGLELTAVATANLASAKAAAAAFGARDAYGDALELCRDPDVDVVSVCVKVPAHREIVLAAAAAGKAVFCEWPLGRDLAETKELATALDAAGVRLAIGLQARANPAALRARELVVSGEIGRVLSVNVFSTTAGFGQSIPKAMIYGEDPANGVNLLTVQGAHTFDLAIAVAGDLESLSALLTTQYPTIIVEDDATRRDRVTADQVSFLGRLDGGGALAVDVVGGRPLNATPFRLDVVGERGTLTLTGGAPRGFQSGVLALTVDGEARSVDDGELGGLPEAAVNVAGLYAMLRDDMLHGTSTAPDATHAVRLWQMIEDVVRSSGSGDRLASTDWPRA